MFTIDSPRYLPYLNKCLKVMRRGQIAWLKIGQGEHNGGYHTTANLKKGYMDREAEVGQTIWLKVEITNIKRDLKCAPNANFEAKIAFNEKVRVICRELVTFEQYSNAADLYSRGAQVFKSIPKTQLELFSELELQQRKDALAILYTNLAFCMIKKNQPSKAVKAAQNAIEIDSTNAKAFFRQAQAYKDLHDFDNSTASFKQAISLQP